MNLPHTGSGVRDGATELLDTPAEEAFDRVTRLAARLLNSPISHLSVIDDRRSFLKSEYGLPDEIRRAREMPLTHSFCKYVVASGERLVVPDTRGHPLVGRNPVIEQYGVLSYLGVPVRDQDERLVCVLCVLDFRTRDWSPQDLDTMEDLAAMLRTELVLRAEIDVRARAEERTKIVMREMEHRVKNSLSTVQAIVSMSLKDDRPVPEMRDSIIERIASLAKTHSLLLEADWQSVSLRDLVDTELRSYAQEGRHDVDGPHVALNAQDSVLVGMVIHELTTNAAKYGALATGGCMTLRWAEIRDCEGRRLRLDWIESGVEMMEAPSSEGFGSTLLDTLITRQQGGQIERDWTSDGLRLRAEIPVAELQS